jgi:hypothetical protein
MTLMHWYLLAGFAVCCLIAVLAMDWTLQVQESWRRYYAARGTDSREREEPATRDRILRFPGVGANSERPNSDHPQEAA